MARVKGNQDRKKNGTFILTKKIAKHGSQTQYLVNPREAD